MKISTISFALLCALNSAIGADLQCENGNCTYSDESSTSIDATTFNDILNKASQEFGIVTLTIDTPNATLTGTGSDNNQFSLGDEANWYSFTINAKNITITNNNKDNKYNAKITANQKSTINANLDITNSHLQVMKSTQYGFDGSLTINGDFMAKDSNIQNATTDTERGQFIVSGKSTITDSTFIVYSLSELSNAEVKALMLTSNGGFNSDITTKNTAQFKIRIDTTMLEKAYDFNF